MSDGSGVDNGRVVSGGTGVPAGSRVPDGKGVPDGSGVTGDSGTADGNGVADANGVVDASGVPEGGGILHCKGPCGGIDGGGRGSSVGLSREMNEATRCKLCVQKRVPLQWPSVPVTILGIGCGDLSKVNRGLKVS